MNRLRTTLALSALALATAGGVALAGTDAPLVSVAPQITDPTGDSNGDAGSDIVSAGLTTSGTVTSTTTTSYVTQTVKAYKQVKVLKKVKVKVKVKGSKKTKVKTKTVVSYKTVPYLTTVQTPVKVAKQAYTPDTLVGTITTAAAPDTSDGSYYELAFKTPTCNVLLEYDPSLLITSSPAGDGTTGYADLSDCGSSSDPLGTVSLEITPTVSGNTITFALPFSDLAIAGVTPGAELTKITASSGTADYEGDPTFGTGVVSAGDVYDDAASDTPYTVA